MQNADLTSYTEPELIREIISGDERAFEQLYKNYSQKIYRNLRRLTKDESLSEELLQEVFVKIWEKRDKLDPEKSVLSFLYRVSGNLVVDFYRKSNRDRKTMEGLLTVATEIIGGPIDEMISREDDSMLYKAISSLPPQRRKIFMLCKIEGRSYEEVGGLLGISPSTISDHIVKAMKAVRNKYFEKK